MAEQRGVTPKLTIKCDEDNVHLNFLRVMNVFFGLTDQEMLLVSKFMEAGDLSTQTRRRVADELGFENSKSINSLIGRIKKQKKAFIKNEKGKTDLHPYLRDVYDSILFEFKSDQFNFDESSRGKEVQVSQFRGSD